MKGAFNTRRYNTGMIDESWYIRPARQVKERLSAGGIIVRKESEGALWLALTCGEGGVGESYILPKGGVDPGEEIEQAARREIEEEAGFSQLELIASLGTRARFSYDKRRWITTHYFLYATEELDPKPTDPNYSYVTHWFALDAPLPALFWPEQRALIQESLPLIRKKLA